LRNIPHCCLPQESGPYLSPSVTGHPLRPATRRRLGRPPPHQQADRPRAHPQPNQIFPPTTMRRQVISSIRPSFPGLSQSQGQVTHVLLTRSPLEYPPKRAFPLDLHVLSTPPAFVLSQDQTLHQGTTTDPTNQQNQPVEPAKPKRKQIPAPHNPHKQQKGVVHCLKEIPNPRRPQNPRRSREPKKGTGF
jgi:hypothetical protein